jgi:Ca2+-binding RTX toxin-like protein
MDGNDVLTGGTGGDDLQGGAGFDIASYQTASHWVLVDLNKGYFQDTIGAGFDRLFSIEQVTGSAFADKLYAADGGSRLVGGGGNDSFVGRVGSDWLMGGDGNDHLRDSGGNDLIDGGLGRDRVNYVNAGAGVAVDLMLGIQNTIGAGIDTISNVEDITGTNFADILGGNATANEIDGGDGHDTLLGGAGNDDLLGGAGNDLLEGGLGIDVMDGGDGSDTVSFIGAGTGVFADLADTGGQSTGGGGYDQILDIENALGSRWSDVFWGDAGANLLAGRVGDDELYGEDGDDVLIGDGNAVALSPSYDDLLDGGAGADLLVGGRGGDTLRGGADADVFEFTVGDGRDVIDDYVVGVDQLRFAGAIPLLGGIQITATKGGALVTYSADDSVLLQGVAATDLSPDMFSYV